MRFGVFVTSVNPSSPSQARLQGAILSAVQRLARAEHDFVVFSYDAAQDLGFGWRNEPLRVRGPIADLAQRSGALVAGALLALWRLAGATGGRTYVRLRRWSTLEPAHFQQLRDLDIRLLWNVNQHELKTPTPYIRTVWEANHRINAMYPEYSYARFGFEALDTGQAESLARASYVLTGTEEGKRQLIALYGVDHRKVRIVPFVAPRLPVGQTAAEGRYVLYPARFWPHKNHVVILEALNILRREHAFDLRCVFTGADGGNLDYVLGYAERLGVIDLIDYRGSVEEDELGSLYSGAWALAYASSAGPDNLPPLEAMTLGCPVIAADVPGAEEQLGDAALRFAPTNEKSLAAQLLRLASEPGLRDELVSRGAALVEQLQPERYAASVLEILDEFSAVARAWERCDSLSDSTGVF